MNESEIQVMAKMIHVMA